MDEKKNGTQFIINLQNIAGNQVVAKHLVTGHDKMHGVRESEGDTGRDGNCQGT